MPTTGLRPSPSATSATATPTPTASATPAALPLAGRRIVIDPGHNGVWTRRELRKVPSGNGRTKECNSSGTATNAGYAEHAYNWAQANALARVLRARGATVRLTRPDDHGEGPCVNLRSRLANQLRADALVSIHADGSLARGARGFHVIVSTTMVGGATVERASTALAKRLRHALETETTMPRSTYIGGGTALSFRSDLGTLNLSERTAVMLEMGNMRNATDAALLGSATFRTRAARALADGLEAYLG
ncbi:N-acetylmuramoyl-L-alanine amidase [Propionicimonas sp.]|uniref:N-acetylmuramoyl-L-alanine amidase n=1 Tax=Propionicimonas sp. TaxID=1955623 RepID=UPI0039E229ED